MNFRTPIALNPARNQIDYAAKIMLLGSCFSENIHQKLAYYKFNTLSNPLGILFHPKAIETFITHAINKKEFTEKDVFSLNERWHCFEAHSSLSAVDKNKLLQNLNTAIDTSHKQLKTATHLVITLGTAWAYRFIETNAFVGNCHKVPQKKFLKELFSVDKIAEILQAVVALVTSENPTVNIIFTVSPVRHLKDGFIENSQSKAHLLAAIHQVTNSKKSTFYFPAYEIMMDDLRDYRFYTEDMVHPNPTAIDYIWEQFLQIWVNKNTHSTLKKVATIQKGLAHKPFYKNSKAHQQFLKNLQIKIEEVQTAFPSIIF